MLIHKFDLGTYPDEKYKPFIKVYISTFPIIKNVLFTAIGSQLTLWAIVNETGIKEEKEFRIYGTGYKLDRTEHFDNFKHVFSTHDQTNFLVWHLFERSK